MKPDAATDPGAATEPSPGTERRAAVHATTDGRSGRRPRVRAPELHGRSWLNTGGRQLSVADFRGRFLLLDFWTFCCVNCLHVLDELRAVEEEYDGELVVVGVHSPKFLHEADQDALGAAVERYHITHPVLDDPELRTWQAYTARAWPTLVLVDPEGYVVAQYAGEGHAHAIRALLAELREEHLARGTLQPGDSPYVPPVYDDTDLRFPAKAVRLPSNAFLVADAGHHQLVELAEDAETVVRRIGSGQPRLTDGPGEEASFNEPNGLCLLPDEVAAEVGYDVVVADTVNHALRGVHLQTGQVTTLAGDGRQWFAVPASLGFPTPTSDGSAGTVQPPTPTSDGSAGTVQPPTPTSDGSAGSLSSPWDVAWWQDRVWVAMAGIHQLWTFDPRSGAVEAAAGTTNEGLLDGPLPEAWFAQTSGLAADGERLWLVDSETSSLRYVEDGEVRTAVGKGLFDFGFQDGPGADALMQHPLGVAVLSDGSVAVADTYNGAVRRFDPRTSTLSTIATGLGEPSGLVVTDEHVLVVESSAHRLTGLTAGTAVDTKGFAHTTARPVTEIAEDVELVIAFEPPPGQQVDDRFGPPSQLLVSATPPALLQDGEGRNTELVRRLRLDPAVGEGVLHVAARAASCDTHGGEGAACHLHQQDWGVPVRVVTGGERRLVLPLSGRAGEDAG